ncbi:MAG: TusE/DsrC/DsvC family sulfur relay protein [Gammaproteobacteria bacterium]
MALNADGKILETDAEGFLLDWRQWDETAAAVLAAANAIVLTSAHWEIVRFMRDYYLRYRHLPNARVFTKAVRHTFGAEKGNSHYLHCLFPEGPLKYACKLAGLPKPPTCL